MRPHANSPGLDSTGLHWLAKLNSFVNIRPILLSAQIAVDADPSAFAWQVNDIVRPQGSQDVLGLEWRGPSGLAAKRLPGVPAPFVACTAR